MYLGNLLKFAERNCQKIQVKGICFDTRKLKKGDVFFAIKGIKTSGDKFVNEAVERGASVIVSDKKIKPKNSNIPFLVVHDVRKSLSEACSKFYKKKPLNIIAVTGTNGKSSVANFFYQILNFNHIPAASIGTLGIISKKYYSKPDLTTMDPVSLHKNLQVLAKNKIKHVILEASSHGLAQKRLESLSINTGIFTNLSHDHLDYHKNIKSYFNAKMHLFRNLLQKNSKIITDEENKEFKFIKDIANRRKLKKITIGKKSGNIKILQNKYREEKQMITISTDSRIINLEIPLIGYFQVKNLLMAVLAALCCGIKKNKILSQIHKIKPVPGRLECIVKLKNNSNIIVDFAHTPEALEESLNALKKQFKKEIVIVFGCGGERDKKKRFIMGKIAKKYCRKIFVTDDNPRNENPKKIRKTIIRGCEKFAVEIGNRKKAIKAAIDALRSNEILLVAGKGHENTQDYGSKILNFSDKKVIKKIIKKKKHFIRKSNWAEFLAQKVFLGNNVKGLNYSGVSINTKTVKKNNLFFAIRGKNTDGHKFVKEAIRKGAIKSVISKNTKQISKNKLIKVKNTFSSLNQLAKVTREKSYARIIGITGSAGKTTLKNLISFSLKNFGSVYHSPHSYNNKFGVPLSVSNLKKKTSYGVFEIGMDKRGEIEKLSKIVKPEIAVITNVSEAHIKNFRNLKDIARAKAEIIRNISKNGNIILNKDGKFFSFFSEEAKKKGVKIISFGIKRKSDIFLHSIKKLKNQYKLKINVKNKIFYFYVKNRTSNFINNFLACVAVISALNLNLNKIQKVFVNFKIPEGRGDIKIIKIFNKKIKFIDESYNANPLSMKSAIENVDSYYIKKNQRKLVLLCDMFELGKKSKQLHKSLSPMINKSNIDKVFVCGNYIRETFDNLLESKKGKIFKNLREAYHHFAKILHNNDLLMVKGSNATGLNQFSKNIKKGKI